MRSASVAVSDDLVVRLVHADDCIVQASPDSVFTRVNSMTSQNEVVFLFDVDNTLLDNDRVVIDLRRHIDSEFGAETSARYFSILEELN